MQVVSVDKAGYGYFHTGDSYIVYNVSGVEFRACQVGQDGIFFVGVIVPSCDSVILLVAGG
jgi:hypothetical protein